MFFLYYILFSGHLLFSGSVELKGEEAKVKAIIQVWLDNVASIDRRLRLLEKMQKEHEAKISAQPFVRFHSDFVGQLLMSESLGIAKVKFERFILLK